MVARELPSVVGKTIRSVREFGQSLGAGTSIQFRATTYRQTPSVEALGTKSCSNSVDSSAVAASINWEGQTFRVPLIFLCSLTLKMLSAAAAVTSSVRARPAVLLALASSTLSATRRSQLSRGDART